MNWNCMSELKLHKAHIYRGRDVKIVVFIAFRDSQQKKKSFFSSFFCWFCGKLFLMTYKNRLKSHFPSCASNISPNTVATAHPHSYNSQYSISYEWKNNFYFSISSLMDIFIQSHIFLGPHVKIIFFLVEPLERWKRNWFYFAN